MMSNKIYECNNKKEAKDEVDEVFEIVVEKLNEHEIPWWLVAGSMLGCYREGKRIEWDPDYDIGYPIEYAPQVLEALLEIPDVYIEHNLYYRVEKVTDILYRDHFVCLKPHVITDKGVFRVISAFLWGTRKIYSTGFYTIPKGIVKIINKTVRKLPLCLQKAVVKFNMQTWVPKRYRGPKKEYSSFYQTKMGDVDVKLPVGVESILERLYGEDFMTPKRKGEYELAAELEDYPDL